MKSKKGISSILGTVIVVAITIALGALLYAYANGMFGNLTQNVDVSAQAQLIVNPSNNQAYLQYTLTNNGNIQVNINEIIIEGTSHQNCTIEINNGKGLILNSGQTYQNIISVYKITVEPGQYYTILFIGNTATNKPFSIALNVLASEAE